MTNITQALRAALEFKEPLTGWERTAFMNGMLTEHARTQALVLAMCEALDQAVGYFEHGSQGAADCFDEALARVREELERMK